jgi:hypothetical protein
MCFFYVNDHESLKINLFHGLYEYLLQVNALNESKDIKMDQDLYIID